MARPERNTVDYFPHKCGKGKKMFFIEQKYGNDGYATWWKILENLAQTENHFLNLNSEESVMFLASDCRVSEDKLFQIINDLVKLGVFNKELWSKKIIWDPVFMESIQDAYKKRSNEIITEEGLRLLLLGLGILFDGKSNLEGAVNPQTKVKKSKVNESKVKQIPELSEFLNYYRTDIEKNYPGLEFSVQAKYEAWAGNDWRDGYNKPILNWKSKLKTAVTYMKPGDKKNITNGNTNEQKPEYSGGF